MRENPSRYAGVTARVEVRQFSEVDVQDFLAYQGLPSVRRYQPGAVMTEAEASAYVVSQARQSDGIRGAWHGRAVELIVERRVIGDVGVWVPAQREHPVVGDLGFQFDPRYQGLGYAGESLEAFIPIAVRTFALDRITASCRDDNRASWRLMERVGMHMDRRSDGERQYSLDLDQPLLTAHRDLDAAEASETVS